MNKDAAQDKLSDAIPHGQPPGYRSPSGYLNHGCRCRPCKRANAAYYARYRRDHPEERREALARRRLVPVRCTSCAWWGRRDARYAGKAVADRPCPKCEAPVTL